MTSDRSYRSAMGRDGPRWAAMGRDVAVAELRAGAAKQFDPEVVRAFRGAGAEAPAGTGALAATRG